MFAAVFVLGLLGLCAAWIWPAERQTMTGIAIGCLPTGALGTALSLWMMNWVARKRPEWVQKKVDALDERSSLVRCRAGHTVYWILFAYVGVYTLVSPAAFLQAVSHRAFGCATLLFMTAVYWAAVAIYNRRY
jgi:hypothetical protein